MLRADGMEEKIRHAPRPNRVNRLADWLTPARVAMVAVLGSIPVKLLTDRLADPDLWWHLRTGRLIVEHGLPGSDVYSFTVHGRPWVTQEWVPEVTLHSLRQSMGLYGILVYRALLVFVLYLIVARLFVRRMGSGVGTWGLLALTAYAGSANWTERPNLISFVLFALTLSLLEGRDRRVWWFLPVAAVWANMHGMVLVGIGLVGLAAATERLKVLLRWPGSDPTHAKRLGLVCAAGVAASLANPAGPQLLVHAFRLIGTVRGLVTEWASPDFHEPTAIVFLVLLLLTVAVLALSPERPDPMDVALALAFTVLALQAVRLLAVSAVVLGVVCARYVRGALATIPRRKAPTRPVGAPASAALGSFGLAITLAAFAALLASGLPRSGELDRDVRERFPVAAIDALNKPGVCLFVSDFWSGIVIDRAWPNVHVFMDLRQDVYGREHTRLYQRTHAAHPTWRVTLDRAGVTHVLVRRSAPIAQVLAVDAEWRLAHSDARSVTYERVADSPRCSVRSEPSNTSLFSSARS